MARLLIYPSFNSPEAVENTCNQQKLRSDCTDALADPSLCWSHKSYCRFCRALAHMLLIISSRVSAWHLWWVPQYKFLWRNKKTVNTFQLFSWKKGLIWRYGFSLLPSPHTHTPHPLNPPLTLDTFILIAYYHKKHFQFRKGRIMTNVCSLLKAYLNTESCKTLNSTYM